MLKAQILTSRGREMVCLVHSADEADFGKKTILFKHGFVGNKITAYRKAVLFDHMLVRRGFTVVRFDCIGAGDSEGDCHDMTIRGELEDTLVVIEYIKKELKPQIFILHGYSMGGCVASLALRQAQPDGLLLWSPVSRPEENFRQLLGEERFAAGCAGQEVVDFLGDRVGREFFVGLGEADIDPLAAVRRYAGPVRIVGGDRDADVACENFKDYLTAEDAKLHLVSGATHYFDTIPQQEELFAQSVEYLEEMVKKAAR